MEQTVNQSLTYDKKKPPKSDGRSRSSGQNLAKARQIKLDMLRQQREERMKAMSATHTSDIPKAESSKIEAPKQPVYRQEPLYEESSEDEEEEEVIYVQPNKKQKSQVAPMEEVRYAQYPRKQVSSNGLYDPVVSEIEALKRQITELTIKKKPKKMYIVEKEIDHKMPDIIPPTPVKTAKEELTAHMKQKILNF